MNNNVNYKSVEAMLGNRDLTQYGVRDVDSRNSSRRLPVIILVDTSASMRGSEKLLKQSVEDLYSVILNDKDATNKTELAVMTFNSEIEILEPMREIRRHEGKGRNLDFVCDGVTLTGLALKTAIFHLEERLQVYKEARPVIRYYAPLLFVLSDGRPECYDQNVKPEEDAALQYARSYIRREVAANKLAVVSVEVGDRCDHKLMQEITGLPDNRHVNSVSDHSRLAEFFKLTSSLIIHSAHHPNQSMNDMDLRAFNH